MAYELIETVEVGAGGAASIEFTSIPQDGTDLVLNVSARVGTGFGTLAMQFNADTASNYSHIALFARSSTVSSFSTSGGSDIYAGGLNRPGSGSNTANTFSNQNIYISNYAYTDDKSVSIDTVVENNDTDADRAIIAASYTTSSGITSIKLFDAANDFVQHSSASLYKVTAA